MLYRCIGLLHDSVQALYTMLQEPRHELSGVVVSVDFTNREFSMREMRRKDRSLSEEEAVSIIKNGEYGVLSTVSSDNDPYGIPISYCYQNGNVYFHCALDGEKLSNINENPRVSFCVVGETQIQPDRFTTRYESSIVSGAAEEVFDNEKQEALQGLISKYSNGFEVEGKEYIQKAVLKTRVFKITQISISGKAKR